MVDQTCFNKRTKNSGNEQISWISQQHEEDCGISMGALQLKTCSSSDVQNNQL